MNIRIKPFWFIVLVSISLPSYADDLARKVAALAQQVTTLNQQVSALTAKNTAQDQQIALLTAANTALSQQVSGISGNSMLALSQKISLSPDGQTVQFNGVNVQIVNGMGQTGLMNGMGNLIIGYDETSSIAHPTCSPFGYNTQTDCEANSGVWDLSQRTGSHNLVLGNGHSYTAFGGIVAGYYNVIANRYSIVSGGETNVANASWSNITGGQNNVASGDYSSVSGGESQHSERSRKQYQRWIRKQHWQRSLEQC